MVQKIKDAYTNFHLKKVTTYIMELADIANSYFDHKKPWVANNHRDATIACSLECVKALALISSPIIPQTAQKIWRLLGYKIFGF